MKKADMHQQFAGYARIFQEHKNGETSSTCKEIYTKLFITRFSGQ